MRWLLMAVAATAFAADHTFVLVHNGKTTFENEDRAAVRYPPCSTFKIPNTLIALETHVASDAAFPITYDPKRDGDQHGAWSRDQDLASAFRNSAAWAYRELARRVGQERMREWVNRFEYGNMATTPAVDRFWLGADLTISAKEQVAFLQRMYEGKLPVSRWSIDTVKELALLETTRDYKWYGKTGSCRASANDWILWHVGFVEKGGAVSYYALNLSGPAYAETGARRAKMLRDRLVSAGLIVAEPPSPQEQMTARIQEVIEAFPGTISVFAKNLDTGATFAIRPDERVRTASTIKLPILFAIFNAIAAGNAKWDERLEMRAADKVSGSGVIRELDDGTKLSIRDLVNMMIVVSDNTATNLLLDRFTADYVNSEMVKLGIKDTKILRKVMGGSPSREGQMEEFRKYGLGVSTPRDMVTLLEQLTPEMIAILQRQQLKDAIGRHQPSNEVASKSGALDRLRSDVGIVRSVGGRIAMALTVDDMLRTDYSPENAGNVVLSRLADLLVDGLRGPLYNLGEPERVIELQGPMDHVQGIHIEGSRLWVSWVDRKEKTGHLGEFDAVSGKLVRSVAVQKGDRFHPGGIAADGTSIWVPVAEYRANSSAVIQKRNRDTLALEAEFEVADHIGCVAVSGDRVYGGNWDARAIYSWDQTGKLVDKRPNLHGVAYQDMQFADGALIGSGLRGGEGAIDWLDPKDLRLHKRVRAGKSNRGVLLTHEGMAIGNGKLYLLPEDGPSRLFVYPLPF